MSKLLGVQLFALEPEACANDVGATLILARQELERSGTEVVLMIYQPTFVNKPFFWPSLAQSESRLCHVDKSASGGNL